MCILVDNDENRIYIKVLFEFSTRSINVFFFCFFFIIKIILGFIYNRPTE